MRTVPFSSLVIAGSLLAQPAIQITSPTDGTIVTPGQTIPVIVSVSDTVKLTGVGIAAADPLPDPVPIIEPKALASRPYQFSISIPAQIALRRYSLVAQGSVPNANFISSDPVYIDVERVDAPEAVSIDYQRLAALVGDQIPVHVWGRYSDGMVLDLTWSTRTSYQATPSGIVSVTKEGLVKALAPGSATVLVHHTIKHTDRRIAVTVRVDRASK